MNTKDAARTWGCSISTVTRYCRDGLVCGCERTKSGYSIPDYARKPAISKAKTEKSIYLNIVKAVDEQQSITAKGFHLPDYRVERYLRYLCEIKFIHHVETLTSGERVFQNLEKGVAFLNERAARKQDKCIRLATAALTAAATFAPVIINQLGAA